ncbi:DUF72 domain-containing protein [Benzoatithermus flavus]|uniref:DUF72 domain-containing protein n=1 Tax=Benzoatithermus flavus TaxID=3108223 RepID=A0ABU8XQR1_9PROT
MAEEARARPRRLGTARVGTSGWTYPNWRGTFYPKGLKQADWLAWYAGRFDTVELNASFYRLPGPAMVARWAEIAPPGFLFAVKASRLLTHERRLAGCAEPLATFLERLAPLGDKLGPILFQLPPNLRPDLPLLESFLAGLPPSLRCAFEFREPGWWTDPVLRLLDRADAAFVSFELAELRSPRIATGSLAYVRLHGHERRYRGSYPERALADWARWLEAERGNGRDVLVYFDNTAEADDAVRNALSLRRLLGHDPAG